MQYYNKPGMPFHTVKLGAVNEYFKRSWDCLPAQIGMGLMCCNCTYVAGREYWSMGKSFI